MATYIIFGLIILLFILAVIKIVRDKKKGKCCGFDSGGGCSGCGSHNDK